MPADRLSLSAKALTCWDSACRPDTSYAARFATPAVDGQHRRPTGSAGQTDATLSGPLMRCMSVAFCGQRHLGQSVGAISSVAALADSGIPDGGAPVEVCRTDVVCHIVPSCGSRCPSGSDRISVRSGFSGGPPGMTELVGITSHARERTSMHPSARATGMVGRCCRIPARNVDLATAQPIVDGCFGVGRGVSGGALGAAGDGTPGQAGAWGSTEVVGRSCPGRPCRLPGAACRSTS